MDFGTTIENSAVRVGIWCDGRTQTHVELFNRASTLTNTLTSAPPRRSPESSSWDELPRSGVGKILRSQVRDVVWKDRDQRIAGA